MFKSFFQQEKNILLIVAGLVFSALLIVRISPVEETLGSSVRLVYLHGSLTWVAIITYTLAGLLGLFHLLSGRKFFCCWSYAFGRTSLLLWVINFLLSLVVMTLIWGKIAWNEPRIIMTTSILFFSLLFLLLSVTFDKPKLIAFFNLLMSIILWISLIKTKVVIHPQNPITSSSSLEIRVSFLLIILFLLLPTLFLTHLLKKQTNR
jgi:hypothetical protein